MLENRIYTQEEMEKHLVELKAWLAQVRDIPVEGMAEFFASRIQDYNQVHMRNWGEIYRHIADYFDPGLKNILDIGCGTGLELAAMFRRFPDLSVTGIDLSETMLEELQKRYSEQDVTVIQADYFEYPFQSAQYQAAMSFETLHHFPFEKKQKIYQRLYDAIVPDGYYIECDYVACCEEEQTLCYENYLYRRSKHQVPPDVFVHIDIPLTLERQLNLMKNAGFAAEVKHQNGSTVIIRADKR